MTTSAPSARLTLSASELRQRQPVVIADFMRPPLPQQTQAQRGMQNSITRNLFTWLEPALFRAFEKAPIHRVWDNEEPDTIPVPQIYQNHDIDPSTIGWIQTYLATPTTEDLELLRPLFADKLVIGFELSPFQCTILEKLETPYISLAIHPLRFLHDYKFMLSSNFANLDALKALTLTIDDISFAAQLKRAQMLQQPPPKLKAASAVLFGQVEIDAALIGPEGVISLQDHVDAVRDLCSAFETVYFKPHPYAANAKDQVRFLQQFVNIELVADNPYALLASTQIHTVAALTSSILTEAGYFGKTARALSSLWVNRAEEPAYGIEVLSPQFWDALLSSAEGSGVDLLAMTRGSVSDVTVKSLLKVSWETHGTAEIPISGLPVELGKKMNFGRDLTADAFCRGAGWKPPSRDHRWAGQKEAFLSFRLPPGNNLDFSGSMTVKAMAKPKNPILLQLICQDHVLGEKFLKNTDRSKIKLNIPGRLPSALGDVEIELRCSHAHGPSCLLGITDMRALSVAINDLTIDLPEGALVFAVGETLYAGAFQPNAPFLPHGWSHPEDTGVWTEGRHARLNLMAGHLPDGDLVLTLGNTRAFLSDVLPSNKLFIHVNGACRSTHTFQLGQPGDLAVGGVDISVPIPRAAMCNDRKVITIDFELVASHSPVQAGYSSDERSLGIMVESYKFEPAIQTVAGQPSGHIANIFGPFNIHTGLAVMARNSFRAIQKAQEEVSVNDPDYALQGPRAINFNNSHHQDEDTDFVQNGETSADINIFSGDVTRVNRIVTTMGTDILRNRYNICYGAWELETLPTYLTDTRHIDEYWGLSTFIADAARKRMNIPVFSFPIPVDLHFPETLAPRKRFNIPEGKFAFLFVFSVDSTMARKNPEAVFEAFQVAFPDPSDPVVLVIKSMIRQASPANRQAFNAFKDRVARDPRVILVEDTLNRDDNASLYMCCDAYVSLHRAEGFGLTMAEAMGYGKPTIGTGYSGNLDFMNEGNSCLVDFDKVEMDPNVYHNQQREWAEPDPHDAALHMRRVFEDILFREKIARAGKRTIYEEFSSLAVGRKLVKRLHEIQEERS